MVSGSNKKTLAIIYYKYSTKKKKKKILTPRPAASQENSRPRSHFWRKKVSSLTCSPLIYYLFIFRSFSTNIFVMFYANFVKTQRKLLGAFQTRIRKQQNECQFFCSHSLKKVSLLTSLHLLTV